MPGSRFAVDGSGVLMLSWDDDGFIVMWDSGARRLVPNPRSRLPTSRPVWFCNVSDALWIGQWNRDDGSALLIRWPVSLAF